MNYNKISKIYFFGLSIIYLFIIFFGSNALSAYFPIFYLFFGPILFFCLHYVLVINLSKYIEKAYPNLMKKHSFSWGVRKGESLNIFQVYLSKEEFESYNDEKINLFLNRGKLLLKLTIASFVFKVIFGIIKSQLN